MARVGLVCVAERGARATQQAYWVSKVRSQLRLTNQHHHLLVRQRRADLELACSNGSGVAEEERRLNQSDRTKEGQQKTRTEGAREDPGRQEDNNGATVDDSLSHPLQLFFYNGQYILYKKWAKRLTSLVRSSALCVGMKNQQLGGLEEDQPTCCHTILPCRAFQAQGRDCLPDLHLCSGCGLIRQARHAPAS